MKERPRILITNDDGIDAPGLKQLWHSLKGIADVTIIAPAAEQSAVGLSLTIRHPLHLKKIDWPDDTPAWSVTGTPADCVKMALSVILDEAPDYVVSGINRGANAGRNVLYSGTVAGAIEGTMQGIPSMAFSCWDYKDTDYAVADSYVSAFLRHIIEHPLPRGTLLNVNFPPKTLQGIKGVKLTRQGMGYWMDNPDKRIHPAEESTYYWLGVRLATFEEVDDCDVVWLREGYIAAVPVHVNELTDHQHLQSAKHAFDNFFSKTI